MSFLKVGFTGTQNGMTGRQKEQLKNYIKYLSQYHPALHAHHGDCIGADAEFHDIMEKYADMIVIHPPDNLIKRAFKKGTANCVALPYLKRNRQIVDMCDVLLAAPKGFTEVVRSGTWATVRYARKKNKTVKIFYPY